MSKIKKERPIAPTTTISEIDIRLIKILNISGWIFLIGLGGFFAVWGLFDMLLKVIDIDQDSVYTFAYVIFTTISAVFSFTLATKIEKSKEKKREFFIDWLIGEFIFCLFGIFVLAVYQW